MVNYFKFSKFTIFNDKFNIDQYKSYDTSHKKIPEFTNYFTPEFKEYLTSVNLTVHLCELFQYEPFEGLGIHIDGSSIDDRCKINVIYGGSKSEMLWYVPKNDTVRPILKETPIGTKYLKYEESDLVILEKAELHGTNVVRVGIPHSIQNYSEYRMCFSIPLIFADTKTPATFKHAKSVLF
jgi:hypothetical protein